MIKMSDVARKANVSTATVSRVLRNPHSVKEETRKKVLRVIEELNYQPNALARQLRTSRAHTILVVVPTITNTVFAQVLGGIDQLAGEYGYRVLLANSNGHKEKSMSYLDHLKQKQVDGVILLTSELGEALLADIAKEYPIVLTSEFIPGSIIPTVSIDNVRSGQQATEHLIQLGHQRIAHLTGPLEGLLSQGRLAGYKEALERHGIPYDQGLVQEGDFSFESGSELMKGWLESPDPPTALFAANDEMAIGAMKAAIEKGIDIPNNLAVVGFDNIQFSSIFEPMLTTVAQPFHDMGVQSMKLLLKQINQEEIEHPQIVLDSELIIRQSCGANKVNEK
ncbi:LacI family DNA-binding transcriptional regulator [Pullulanibacillus sp. KACC 23026]|uniref:LacI family DNA-binding transcriptional regulator n=1 Tax=Pullulanibacillus sp. KACC 23026 TaxID=3028315 RepID=UPI0023AEC470|nr:LacI family DNA-binding transcriptional regulator [Pullulanibacillus sp. KACC 23026]WEG11844.1 LacI family DNA-binding transcriptional regulator [Pullulanibacillus sp. KACC 23026]